MSYTPTFPAEFFQPDELREMSGSKQPALIVKWLTACGTPFTRGRHGWPLVYRHAFQPTPGTQPAAEFNFEQVR